MISASNLTLRRGGDVLLADASFTLHARWRVGVVGRNGTGKSSLFAALMGELSPDKGTLTSLRQLAVASVAQETPARPDAAIEYTLDGDPELRALERRLQRADAERDAEAIGAVHERLNTIGGYAARARAARLLHGLGFSADAQTRPIASFSGGWRMRINLARALMCRSDVLLLDEPTNHLDLDAVIWLQSWLRGYEGTLLVISHDREFLDAVTDHTIHLEATTATLYTGNYSQFERVRAERLALQASNHARQQQQMAHLQSYIDRFRVKATKARQAQSRIKQLERMERVAAVHLDSPFTFRMPRPDRLPSPLLRFHGVTAGYTDTPVLEQVKVLIAPGERIGILGANGAGKSTLVRTLAGALPPLGGEALRDPYLRVGYFAQHTTDNLDVDASPMLHFKRLDADASEQTLRDFLGSFDFRGDRAFEPVGNFSGGEKARLALALLVYVKPNLLLLDEPTNHLDMDMRHALEAALLDYPGAVVLVSHDRHLLASICDQLWLVAGGRCQHFDGDLDDYASWLLRGDAALPASVPSKAPESKAARSSPRSLDPAQARARTKPLRESLKQLESRMQRAQRKLEEIEQKMADPALYRGDTFEVARLAQQQGELRKSLNQDEEAWLSTSEQIDQLTVELRAAS